MSYGQRPHLSSMMQDGAAPDTDLHPLLLPGSFLMWTGEGPGHGEISGSLALRNGQRRQVVRAPLKAPSSHLWAGQSLEPEKQSAVRHHRPSLAKVIKYWQLQLVCFHFRKWTEASSRVARPIGPPTRVPLYFLA